MFEESLASPLSPLFRATLGGALSSVPDDNYSIPGIGAAPLRLTDARVISTLSVDASPLSNLLAPRTHTQGFAPLRTSIDVWHGFGE